MIGKIYTISLKRHGNSGYKRGWEHFLKKHENLRSMSKINYISNKWLDVVYGVQIPQDMVYKHQAVVLYHLQQQFHPKICTPHIIATHRKKNKSSFII